jgi:hypothetical protein
MRSCLGGSLSGFVLGSDFTSAQAGFPWLLRVSLVSSLAFFGLYLLFVAGFLLLIGTLQLIFGDVYGIDQEF